MDLIDRAAAIETLGEPHPLDYNRISAVEKIRGLPSVEAVPLDKLCGWLERYATMDCDGCRASIGSCEDEENHEVSVCNSWERWKAMLTKWMEEQHET